MPDASGNIKGISMFGLKNAWLEEVEMRKRLAKRHEEEQLLYDRLADAVRHYEPDLRELAQK